MHRRSHLYLLPSILISLVLSSCQLLQISPTLGTKSNDHNTIPITKTDFSLKADGSTQADMITFPLLVPLQPMTPAQSLPKGKVFDVNLTTSTGKLQNGQIRIPPNGTFKVSFQSGQHSRIIDDDASTDGLAVVEIPSGTYDGFVGADVTGSSKLTIENSLYYQKQDIIPGGTSPIELNGKKPSMQFYQIGTRQLPTQANWHSPDGQNFVLGFTNQGTNQATIRWNPSSSTVPMPIGVKEIGSAGGVIELPQVAKLEIPAGAIPIPTTIRISQTLQARSQEIECPLGKSEYCRDGMIIVTPIVKIEPLNFKPKIPVTLTFKEFREAYQRHPIFLMPAYSLTPENGFLINFSVVSRPLHVKRPEDAVDDMPVIVNNFAHICKQAPGPRRIAIPQSFRVNQVLPPEGPESKCKIPEPYISDLKNFVIYDEDARQEQFLCKPVPEQTIKDIANALESSYKYYNKIGLNATKRYDLATNSLKPEVPIMIQIGTRILSPSEGGRLERVWAGDEFLGVWSKINTIVPEINAFMRLSVA